MFLESSIEAFKQNLKRDKVYIYVHRTFVNKEGLPTDPGHIAFFLTDGDSKVINDSVVSLRPNPQKRKIDKVLKYKSPTDNTKIYSQAIWEIKFYDFEEELEKYFFNKAYSASFIHERFLFGIDISLIAPLMKEMYLKLKDQDDKQSILDFLTNRALDIKSKLKEEEYILCAGRVLTVDNTGKTVKEEDKESMNCVTGILLELSMKVAEKTSERNPSPQAVARAFANLIFGSDEVKDLIANSKMEYINDIRKYDIELEQTEIDKLKRYSDY